MGRRRGLEAAGGLALGEGRQEGGDAGAALEVGDDLADDRADGLGGDGALDDVEVERDVVVSGRFRLVMARFDYDAVERYVAKRIAQATGADWDEVATKLARWSRWEFEDYSASPPER